MSDQRNNPGERKVLILTDGKAGHENQSKAFARALGCGFDLVEVHFRSKFAKALSYLFDNLGLHPLSLVRMENEKLKMENGGISSSITGQRSEVKGQTAECSSSIKQSNNLKSNNYLAVLGTGSGTFYAAKALARRLGVKCGVVLYPRGYRISTFDCVLAPVFDRPAAASNVIEIPANLVASDEAFYEKGVASFLARPELGGKRPDGDAVAVIVGGPNKCSTMTPEWMKSQLDAIFEERAEGLGQRSEVKGQTAELSSSRNSNNPNNSNNANNRTFLHWVTTSRRTPPEVEAVIDSYPWDFKLLYSKDHFNPIPAFVKLAKRLYVTAESTGMLSEACTFGAAEVRVLDNLNPGPHKFRRFVENLRREGYVESAAAKKIDLSAEFARAKQLLT